MNMHAAVRDRTPDYLDLEDRVCSTSNAVAATCDHVERLLAACRKGGPPSDRDWRVASYLLNLASMEADDLRNQFYEIAQSVKTTA